MTKKQKIEKILKLLQSKDYTWEVLSQSKNGANHIRVKNFGDIWPTTGTWRQGHKWHKKDFNGLVLAIGGGDSDVIPKHEPSNKERLETLEALNIDILERLKYLEIVVTELVTNPIG